MHEVDRAVSAERTLDHRPTRHVEEAEHHDDAAPFGRAALVVALDGAQPRGAVREHRALRHAGGTAGEEDHAHVLAGADAWRRGRRRAPRASPSWVTRIGRPSGSAAARATSSESGWATTRRGVSVSNADAASGSVKFGLIGARTAPAFADAVAELERVERGRTPPHDPIEWRDALGAHAGARRGSRRRRAGRRCERRRRGSRRFGSGCTTASARQQVVDADVHVQAPGSVHRCCAASSTGGVCAGRVAPVKQAGSTTNVAPRGGRGVPAGRRRSSDPAGGRHVGRSCRRRALPDRRLRGPATGRGWCSTLARGGDRDAAVRGAASVELLHLGTLVHDDIVDGSPQRRHAPTLHVSLGLPVALWTADALVRRGAPPRRRGLSGRWPRPRRRAAPDRRQPDARGARCDHRPVLGRGRRQDGVAVRGGVRPRRRGRRGVVAAARARRGAPVRAAVPVRRRPPGHRGRGRTRWASRPVSTPTTSCTRCPPPISWSRRTRCALACASSRIRSRASRRRRRSTTYFAAITTKLLDAAARVLDRAPAPFPHGAGAS